MNINTIALKDFRKEVEVALEGIGQKYGLRITGGNIQYNESELKMRLICVSTELTEDKSFEKHCARYGFKKEDYGRMFTFPGTDKDFMLVGFKPNARVNSCVIFCMAEGKEYVTSPTSVKAALGLQDETSGR